MRFIVFDLEATCWKDNPLNQESEIIEIGAFKLDEYGEVLSSFSKFVKPILHPFLSPYCKHLTSIEQEDINKAQTFDKVIEAFKDWVDIYGEEYWLCAWGKFDQKLLEKDCVLHRLESGWLEPYIDLKKQYHEIKGRNKLSGMQKVLKQEGFQFEGTPHRANYDAANLLKLFKSYLDVWQY